MRPRSDGAGTRERLLDAAERLFAEHGIGAVSLRQINAASGARNVSAVHYHFGSKDAVVATLVERRMRELNHGRLVALAAVDAAAGDGPPDLRALVEAVLRPGLDLATTAGASWIRFVARALADPSIALERLAPPEYWEMLSRFGALLRRALPQLPDDVVAQRARFCTQQLMAAVGALERERRTGRRFGATEQERFTRDLVDYAVGGLTAPMSRTA
jgi:AcrR family transcriptional regulator